MDEIEIEDIEILCKDKFAIAARLFKPKTLKAAVLIAPATGIKKEFYQSFATFLSENGYAVLTFDNRGIGGSVGPSINEDSYSLFNWGKLDMTASLNHLMRVFPDIKYHLVGHSAGGQLVGLMENAEDLTSIFNFACSSGSLRNMPYPFKLQAHFFMNIFIPLSNSLFGHTKSQWVGMGEPLPKIVASDWRRWCNGQGYVAMDFGSRILDHAYDELELPSLWLHASDDSIANVENVKEMIGVYKNISADIITLSPQELSYKDIGHMKFFRSKRKGLWKYAVDWFKTQN